MDSRPSSTHFCTRSSLPLLQACVQVSSGNKDCWCICIVAGPELVGCLIAHPFAVVVGEASKTRVTPYGTRTSKVAATGTCSILTICRHLPSLLPGPHPPPPFSFQLCCPLVLLSSASFVASPCPAAPLPPHSWPAGLMGSSHNQFPPHHYPSHALWDAISATACERLFLGLSQSGDPAKGVENHIAISCLHEGKMKSLPFLHSVA